MVMTQVRLVKVMNEEKERYNMVNKRSLLYIWHPLRLQHGGHTQMHTKTDPSTRTDVYIFTQKTRFTNLLLKQFRNAEEQKSVSIIHSKPLRHSIKNGLTLIKLKTRAAKKRPREKM